MRKQAGRSMFLWSVRLYYRSLFISSDEELLQGFPSIWRRQGKNNVIARKWLRIIYFVSLASRHYFVPLASRHLLCAIGFVSLASRHWLRVIFQWPWMTMKTTNGYERQRMTMNDNEWQRMTMNDHEWLRMPINDYEWPLITQLKRQFLCLLVSQCSRGF